MRGASEMKNKTVLLVEDNADDEALMLRALRKNNIDSNVHVARDGQQALDFLFGDPSNQDSQNAAPLPHMVLLDLKLPKIDGLEVLQRLRANERTRTIPVIVMTSSVEKRDLAQSYSLGANSYVRKPVDFSQFVEATRQLGLYWLVLNETPIRD